MTTPKAKLNHTENVQSAISPEAVGAYAQKIIGFASGHYVTLMVHLGDRLGLY